MSTESSALVFEKRNFLSIFLNILSSDDGGGNRKEGGNLLFGLKCTT